jgi:hypothetical protein
MQLMTRLEAILRDAQALSADELSQLLAALLAENARASDADEAAAGQRGLASWTESTREEDWSAFYPESLRNGRSRSA